MSPTSDITTLTVVESFIAAFSFLSDSSSAANNLRQRAEDRNLKVRVGVWEYDEALIAPKGQNLLRSKAYAVAVLVADNKVLETRFWNSISAKIEHLWWDPRANLCRYISIDSAGILEQGTISIGGNFWVKVGTSEGKDGRQILVREVSYVSKPILICITEVSKDGGQSWSLQCKSLGRRLKLPRD